MEHRTDLEQLLLDGLPTDERRQTVATIKGVTYAKLAKLRATHRGEPFAGELGSTVRTPE